MTPCSANYHNDPARKAKQLSAPVRREKNIVNFAKESVVDETHGLLM
jgi:hypothetical protein